MDCARLLIDAKATPDTGAVAAAATGRDSVLRFLLSSGASASAALVGAAESGTASTALVALDYGAQASQGLKIAAEYGHAELVKLMIARGASPNDGIYPACKSGHVSILRILVDLPGCDVTNPEHRALYGAAESGYEMLLAQLLSKSMPPQPQAAKDDAVRRAAEKGHVSCVRLLIDSGAKPNVAITGAASGAYVGILSGLLAKDGDASVALYAASKYGHQELVTLLLDAGAEPKSGIAAAAQHGQSTILNLLLERTPGLASYACQNLARCGHFSLFKQVLASHPTVDADSCLIEACRTNRKEIVAYLIEEKLATKVADAIAAAAQGGVFEICEMLIRNGAPIDEAIEMASKHSFLALVSRLRELRDKNKEK